MRRRGFLVGGLGLALLPTITQAHPYHATSAVADVRRGRLEVALTVTPEDLQEALRRQAGRALDIDTDPEVDALARAYVESRFVLQHRGGAVSMTWVGAEIEADAAHLYFEFTLPKDPSTVTVHNAIFFELAPAQLNRVLVRRGKSRRTLRFRASDPAMALLGP